MKKQLENKRKLLSLHAEALLAKELLKIKGGYKQPIDHDEEPCDACKNSCQSCSPGGR